jgi:AcrR family transcriptional regulator
VLEDPTDAILGAAARLFGELGVAGTTMSRIAVEVGLRQSSLYYYVRSREEVVAALMERANVVPLALAKEIASGPGSVPCQLFLFIKGDVEALCALPFDINEVHRIAAREPALFATYWNERRTLERRLAALVRRGVDEASLRSVEPRMVALTIMGNDEGVQNWYRGMPSTRTIMGAKLSGAAKPPTRPPPRPRPAYGAAKVARSMAELTVAGLLAPGFRLAKVIEEADRIAAHH